MMEDEAGPDEKIIAVPVDQLNPYAGVHSYKDLPAILCDQIAHFFRHYKDLEQGKWVRVMRWASPDEAATMIQTPIERAGRHNKDNP
jgi:inorganic pyrophosphatase